MMIEYLLIGNDTEKRPEYIVSVCGGFVWFTALLITNTTISVTGSYLSSGLIPAILLLADGPGFNVASLEEKSISYKLPAVLAAMGLLTDSRIAVPSTISTPVFDNRLLEYWSYFPERYPTLVVMDYGYYGTPGNDFIMDSLHLQEPIAENAEFIVYRTDQPLLTN